MLRANTDEREDHIHELELLCFRDWWLYLGLLVLRLVDYRRLCLLGNKDLHFDLFLLV